MHDIVSTSAFLGKKYHRLLYARCGKLISRLHPALKEIPHTGPITFFRADKCKKAEMKNYEQELKEICEKTKVISSRVPILIERYRAQALDCFLYAQENQYLNKKNEKILNETEAF